jgi:hypothetical protein
MLLHKSLRLTLPTRVAPYAFLGSSYDDRLVDLYTSGVAKDLIDAKWLPTGLLGTSLLKQEPLRRMVEKHITADLLKGVAAEHRKGRRLLVLTSNLDSQRAVIWDMGAIANSGRPDALRLFQDVLIASASIPGIYPAVLIRAFRQPRVEEMHSDGGSGSQILTVPDGFMTTVNPAKPRPGVRLNMYVLVNNAQMPEFANVRNSTLSVMARACAIQVKSQREARFWQATCLRSALGFISMWHRLTDRSTTQCLILSTPTTCRLFSRSAIQRRLPVLYGKTSLYSETRGRPLRHKWS